MIYLELFDRKYNVSRMLQGLAGRDVPRARPKPALPPVLDAFVQSSSDVLNWERCRRLNF